LGVPSAAYQSTNRILMALSPKGRRALWPCLSRRAVKRGEVLYEMGTEIRNLYFVESGLITLAKPMHDGRAAEIGAIGREGIVTPTGVFGGTRTVMEFAAQIPGTVLQVAREDFWRQLRRDAEFAAIIERYVAVVMSQLTQTAACNMLHSIEERCCRWLLIAHDSALADSFPMTHEFLGTMLGVRRAGVQAAAAALQRRGFISYSRGCVRIQNRRGLESAVCECYETIRGQFESVRNRADARRAAGISW
jgi:CRP-like cAMP-binding protein